MPGKSASSAFADAEGLKRATEAKMAELAAQNAEKPARRRAERQKRSAVPFVMVPLPWLTEARSPLDADSKLYLYILHKSHGGKNPVRVTIELGAEIGILERQRGGSFGG